jgi:bifunctional UDP-N-acetylglucosamine pyrophosphorylase/glucosamine-1-phosphate N-acetyltransferase
MGAALKEIGSARSIKSRLLQFRGGSFRIIARPRAGSVSLQQVKAVVLAAAAGEPAGSSRPAAVQSLVGRPVLSYVLAAVRGAGIADVTVVAASGASEIRALAGSAALVEPPANAAPAEALACCRKRWNGFDGEILVLGAASPLVTPATLEWMVRGLRDRRADAVLLSSCVDDPRGYARVARGPDGAFGRLVEEADATEAERGIQEADAGIYVFRAAPLREALERGAPRRLTDLVNQWATAGRRVETARPPDPTEVYAVRSTKDLVAATNFLRWKILERHLAAGVTIVDPSTTYIEQDVSIGPGTILHPFCVIRAGVTIGAGCQVGPFAHLREGAVLKDGAEVGDYVELKNTTLGEQSKAKHLAYLGDATIGAGVNIGAGTITANYDGRAKHRTVIEDGVFTGCNTVLVAPVTLKKNSKTGAGAVVLRGQDVPEGRTVVGVPARPLDRSQP